MFSKMSADRFEKDRESAIGPGSYEIPTTLDDHAAVIAWGAERFNEISMDPGGAFPVYEDNVQAEALTPRPPSVKLRRSTRRLSAARKENKGSNAADDTAKKAAWRRPPSEAEQQLRRQLAEEERRRVAEAAAAKVAAKDLQKKVEELSVSYRAAQRRISELDADQWDRKKTLNDKEQLVAALQKSLASAKSQLEERASRIEDLGGAEVEQLRREVAVLRERLATANSAEATREAAGSTRETFEDAWAEVRSRLGGLEQRFATQTSEAEEGLQTLVEAHNRLTLKARERLASAEQRVIELAEALHEAKAQEAAAIADGTAQAATSARLEVEAHLGPELAQLRGRFFTSEQALEMSRERQAQLEAARQGAEAEAEQLRGRAQELETLLSEAVSRHVLTVAELAARAAEVSSLRASQEELEKTCGEMRAVRSHEECRVESQNIEIQDMTRRRHKSEALAEARQAEVVRLQQQLEMAQEEAGAVHAARISQQRAEDVSWSLGRQCDQLTLQNSELLATVEAFKTDCAALRAELRCAEASERFLQTELDRDRDRLAQLAGHNNHRQKIQYMMEIKEENVALRMELRKVQQRLVQLEAGRRGEASSNVRASLNMGQDGTSGIFADFSASSQANATRLLHVQDSALECISIDYFMHLLKRLDEAAQKNGIYGSNGLLEWLRNYPSGGTASAAVERFMCIADEQSEPNAAQPEALDENSPASKDMHHEEPRTGA